MNVSEFYERAEVKQNKAKLQVLNSSAESDQRTHATGVKKSFEADDVRVQVSPSFLDIKSEYTEFIFSSLHRLTADERIWFINEAHGLWL